jgi:phage tail-like protein
MTKKIADDQPSSYLAYLPAIFQQPCEDEECKECAAQPPFLGRFLRAFEHLLSGLGNMDDPGLLERVEGIDKMAGLERYFTPGPDTIESQRTPEEFLPWLANWVALTLREEWDIEERRRLISQIVPLYRLRGTKEGLRKLLSIYISREKRINENLVTIDDQFDQFPHFFRVQLIMEDLDPIGAADEIRRKERIARTIIDQEKPAHTYYALNSHLRQTMRIGKRSTIGKDTLLGSQG